MTHLSDIFACETRDKLWFPDWRVGVPYTQLSLTVISPRPHVTGTRERKSVLCTTHHIIDVVSRQRWNLLWFHVATPSELWLTNQAICINAIKSS